MSWLKKLLWTQTLTALLGWDAWWSVQGPGVRKSWVVVSVWLPTNQVTLGKSCNFPGCRLLCKGPEKGLS